MHHYFAESLTAMNRALSYHQTDLDSRSLFLVQLAALVAVDAPVQSYHLYIGAADDAGVSIEEVQAVLIAATPIVGAARTMSAAAKIAEVLGLQVDVLAPAEDE